MSGQRVSRICWLVGLMGLTLLGGTAFFLSSCSTSRTVLAPPPSIEGAVFVGNKVCADCHTNITGTFPASPHARLHLEGKDRRGWSGCESCHGPGSKHVAAGGGKGRFIVNPGRDPSSCYQCHLSTHTDFQLPHHHPVPEGKMNCVQCHDPHGRDIFRAAGGLAIARQNESCATCHRAQSRPFVFEHEAMRDGCVVCHNPHGSINRGLLIERDANLCLKCHAQNPGTGANRSQIFIGNVPHTDFLKQGTCWSAGCHSAIHGSNIDRRLRY